MQIWRLKKLEKKKLIVKLSDSYSSSPDDFTSKAIKQTKKIFQRHKQRIFLPLLCDSDRLKLLLKLKTFYVLSGY